MRIRSIKPEFWRSTDISNLAIEDRFLFIGLWSHVDDNGVGIDKLANVVADLFADDMINDPRETVARVSRGLQNLSEAGRIVRYTVDDTDYLEITNWAKHQRIDKPNKARFPRHCNENAVIRDTLARVTESYSPGTEEQGNRGTEEQGNRVATSDEAATDNNHPEINTILDYLDNQLKAAQLPLPNRTKHNRDAVRLMLTKDGHTFNQIIAAIDWTFQDEFWRTNIRSASKLREKWGQLRGAAQRQQNTTPRRGRAEQVYLAEKQRLQQAQHPDRLEISA